MATLSSPERCSTPRPGDPLAWADTRVVVRDLVLLAVGGAGAVHEIFIAGGGVTERPFVIGLIAGCLGVPVVLAKREGAT